MCGLFGWQFHQIPSKQTRQRLARVLAVANDQRGGQSWGAYGGGVLMRGLGPLEQGAKLVSRYASVMAHSRWATHGERNINNTHPFVEKHITLMHNGMLSNHDELNHHYSRNHEVDSQHLLSHMVAGLDFSDIEGYGTVVWQDSALPTRISMARMSASADLAVAEVPGGVVWSSNEDDLKRALRTVGLEAVLYQIPVGAQHYVERGKFYVDSKLPKLEIKEMRVRHWSSFPSTLPMSKDLVDGQDDMASWRAWMNDGLEVTEPEFTEALSDLEIDAAKLYLEEVGGVTDAAFDGMTHEEIVILAEDMGFEFGASAPDDEEIIDEVQPQEESPDAVS